MIDSTLVRSEHSTVSTIPCCSNFLRHSTVISVELEETCALMRPFCDLVRSPPPVGVPSSASNWVSFVLMLLTPPPIRLISIV